MRSVGGLVSLYTFLTLQAVLILQEEVSSTTISFPKLLNRYEADRPRLARAKELDYCLSLLLEHALARCFPLQFTQSIELLGLLQSLYLLAIVALTGTSATAVKIGHCSSR
ncbi:hypothetical protein EDD16DRAFT_1676500 [Pisolithus croceorrhizus]|nr:hypothetical protein EDD16DRAFT_1676500 [Pisolithus croceorrhizus]